MSNTLPELTYIFYLREKESRQPFGAIGLEAAGPDDIRFSVSICSENDNFSKKVARAKVLGRLQGEDFAHVRASEVLGERDPVAYVINATRLLSTNSSVLRRLKTCDPNDVIRFKNTVECLMNDYAKTIGKE